jgi:membrane-associated PAP2 superfamily phosphatase
MLRALAYLALVPILVGGLKAITGQACPDAFSSFGGSLPDSLLYWKGARCFPAGHASAGFALLGPAALVGSTSGGRVLRAVVLLWGLTIGVYQMAKGAHFLSDTIATLGLSLVFYAALFRSWYVACKY